MLLEQAHLANGAPSLITRSSVTQEGVGDHLESARRVEACGELERQPLNLSEAAVPGRTNGLLIKRLRIRLPPLDARHLRRYQVCPGPKILRAAGSQGRERCCMTGLRLPARGLLVSGE